MLDMQTDELPQDFPLRAEYLQVVHDAFAGLDPGHRANHLGAIVLRPSTRPGVLIEVWLLAQGGSGSTATAKVMGAGSPTDLMEQLRRWLEQNAPGRR